MFFKTRSIKGKRTAGISLAALLLTSVITLAGNFLMPSASATFPGENGRIAFTSERDGNFEIYAMNSDGGGITRLTNNIAQDREPDWSPDGTKIAFTSTRDTPGGEIYVMNADGTGVTRLTNNTVGDGTPSWSPDGTKIAFTSFRDGNGEIYVMNADGSNVTRLTNISNLDTDPDWSPDGTKLVFTRYHLGTLGAHLWVMNADGTGQTNISDSSSGPNSWSLRPSWSPDGEKIAFSGNRDSDFGVFVTDVDGSNTTSLLITGIEHDSPTWSPDGTKIAFVGANGEIHVMGADGSNPTLLMKGPALEFEPDWGTSPDVAPSESNLTVNAIDLNGDPVRGMWTVIRSSDGSILKTGFTPVSFTVTTGMEYRISVANYSDKVFSKWQDDESTSRARTVIPSSTQVTLTAVYDTGDALRGFTSLTYTGTAEQPDLAVNAVSLDGNQTLHMWVIIDPQSSESGTTYKVYIHNYRDIVFEHWEDGSTDRVRTLSIEDATTITAYYQTG
jgi:Tol biopolymer transport system component